MKRFVFGCLALAITGCGRSPVNHCDESVEPLARAAGPTLARVGTRLAFNGSQSVVGAGAVAKFQWTLTEVPLNSRAMLTDTASVNPTLLPDVVGRYTARLVVGDGCRTSPPSTISVTASPGSVNGNQPPLALAGTAQTVMFGSVVTLDGTGSSDPEGAPLTFVWTLVLRPPGSAATLDNATSQQPKFKADRTGTYTLSLVVNDGVLDSAPGTVTILATSTSNRAPTAHAGMNQMRTPGMTVSLDGSASSDPDGNALTFKWTLTTRPATSAAVISPLTAVKPTFVADVAGTYLVSLVVNDGSLNSAPSTMTVTVGQVTPQTGIAMLNHRVVDAEYSRALERIVTVSTGSSALHVYDPVTKLDTSVALNVAPTTVALSLDGQFAAVGHNGWISYVKLSPLTLVKTLAVSCDVIDVVLPADGFVHAFPRVDQWTTIRSVNILSGVETTSGGTSIRAGTLVKLHPTGTVAYGANNGLSPSDIEKYNLATGAAAVLYDSPYHGDHPMCGNLWLTDTGDRIFTRCGNVFRSSTIQSMDMQYAGALSGATLVEHLDHSSAAQKVALIPENGFSSTTPADVKVRLYEDAFLQFQSEVTLPKFQGASGMHDVHGRFVFFNSAGTSHFVVAQVDPSASAQLDWGVVTY